MTREHGGYTWTYDRDARYWEAAAGGPTMMVFVGHKGPDGRTASWIPRRAMCETGTLADAMDEEIEALARHNVQEDALVKAFVHRRENDALREEVDAWRELYEGLSKRKDKVTFWRTMAAIWFIAAVIGLLT